MRQVEQYSSLYSTFRANPAKTGGLIFVTLILFPKLHFLYFVYLKDNLFLEHIWLSKKITCEIKVHEDINVECFNPDHWIQQKTLPILDYKNSLIRQLFQVLQLFHVFKDNCLKTI